MIAIIDYGMGNLRSVQNAFETAGHRAIVTRDARVISDASHVVLPGVGAFGDCMGNLSRYDLLDPIHQTVRSGKPFLGICLGLQVLFTESDEFGSHRGLNIIPGRVRRFTHEDAQGVGTQRGGTDFKIPHVGWNEIEIVRPTPVFGGIQTGVHCYFVHSYHVEPEDARFISSVTDYGIRFVSSVWKDNVVACQFHPEKSQSIGLRLLRNFGAWR
jgi:imidazole glycerol-phosphate synthase subunit HisH